MDDVERRLVLAIQRAPLDQPPWLGFVRELRQALGGNLANVVFRLPSGERQHSAGVRDAPDEPAWLQERSVALRRFDPMPYFTMVPGRVYAYEEFDTVKALTEDPFREQFLRAADFHHLIIFKVVETSGSQMWVTVTRSVRAEPFDGDARALCTRLVDHLSEALATHAALIRLKTQVDVYARAADTLSFGVIGLGEEGQVISVDDGARRTLEETSALSVTRERLSALEDDRSLQLLIAETLKATPEAPPSSIRIGGAHGLDLLLIPQAVRADGGPLQPRVLVYLSRYRRLGPDVPRRLRQLFGLTDTQARLATRMASGCSLAEAAAEVGITEQTARTYSKEIYAKIGVSRQGELIQRILGSVAILDGRPGVLQ